MSLSAIIITLPEAPSAPRHLIGAVLALNGSKADLRRFCLIGELTLSSWSSKLSWNLPILASVVKEPFSGIVLHLAIRKKLISFLLAGVWY